MHIPVLLHEVITGLEPIASDIILDATAGGGGHAEALCRAAPGVTLIAIDADASAVEHTGRRLAGSSCTVHTAVANFRNLDHVLTTLGISRITKALFDLGFSSIQIDASGRGFSFRTDEPLRMTYAFDAEDSALSADIIVNEWSEHSLTDILRGFGEERYARRIAAAIVAARAERPITTTQALADVVAAAVPSRARHGRIHPATRTFQALRIAANDEFGALTEGLAKVLNALSPAGRIAVITFHSGEDRIVKSHFREWQRRGLGQALTKRPLAPQRDEIEKNPRARSAKLRIFQKT